MRLRDEDIRADAEKIRAVVLESKARFMDLRRALSAVYDTLRLLSSVYTRLDEDQAKYYLEVHRFALSASSHFIIIDQLYYQYEKECERLDNAFLEEFDAPTWQPVYLPTESEERE